MSVDQDFEDAIAALARIEGKSPDEIKRDMLRQRITGRGSVGSTDEQPTALARRPGAGDASGASLARLREEALERHHAQAAPGSPVVRYDRDPYGETPAEAKERWLEEEAALDDGVHGLGGSTAGGIFGDGPIATNIYDPAAMARTDSRVGAQVNARMLGLIERLEQRLASRDEHAQLGRGQRGSLPGGSTRRLGRGKR